MSKTESKKLEPWDFHDLPEIGEMNNVNHEGDRIPTPDGEVRAYFNDTLMRSLTSERFTIEFDSEPGEPYAFVFQAPVSMWPDDEPDDPALETMMTDEEIPIGEQRNPSPHKRVFVPASEVLWEFEIVLETTPYEVDDEI